MLQTDHRHVVFTAPDKLNVFWQYNRRLFAGLLFGALKYGGSKIQDVMGAPTEVINIMIGIIIFFVAMPKLIRMILAYKKRRERR